MQTRSRDNIVKPKQFFLGLVKYPLTEALVAITSNCVQEPTSFTNASKHVEWRKAMNEEFTALMHNGTWSRTPTAPHEFSWLQMDL